MVFLKIENDGQDIKSTNYFYSDYAMRGLVYCSINDGAVRLLLSALRMAWLNEMVTGSDVILSIGPWPDQGKAVAMELLFEDGSPTPFCLHLSPEQFDRLPLEKDGLGEWVFAVWTQDPDGTLRKSMEWPLRIRRVPKIPWLKPWENMS